MSNLIPPRRSTSSFDDKLIPLINIVFLLLIFFMCAGRISALHNDVIEPPTSVSTQKLDPGVRVIGLERNGTLSLDGATTTVALLEVALNGVERIAIKADRNATAAHLRPLFDVLRDHHIANVTLYSLRGSDQ